MPGLNAASGLLLMAVVTNTWSPHTTGLECASPGSGARHRIAVPFAPSQVSGNISPSAMPDADGPPNEGQLPGAGAAWAIGTAPGAGVRTIRRAGSTSFTLVPSGSQ